MLRTLIDLNIQISASKTTIDTNKVNSRRSKGNLNPYIKEIKDNK